MRVRILLSVDRKVEVGVSQRAGPRRLRAGLLVGVWEVDR
jgi:hypothetical protein